MTHCSGDPKLWPQFDIFQTVIAFSLELCRNTRQSMTGQRSISVSIAIAHSRCWVEYGDVSLQIKRGDFLYRIFRQL